MHGISSNFKLSSRAADDVARIYSKALEHVEADTFAILRPNGSLLITKFNSVCGTPVLSEISGHSKFSACFVGPSASRLNPAYPAPGNSF